VNDVLEAFAGCTSPVKLNVIYTVVDFRNHCVAAKLLMNEGRGMEIRVESHGRESFVFRTIRVQNHPITFCRTTFGD
jgi:hypothetical protein